MHQLVNKKKFDKTNIHGTNVKNKIRYKYIYL
jgi:hypothetical protein